MFEHAEGAAVGAASGQAACYDFSSFDLHILSHAMAIIALWQDPIQCVIIFCALFRRRFNRILPIELTVPWFSLTARIVMTRTQ